MKNSKVLKTILFTLGLMLIIFGAWRVAFPVEFFEFSGLTLDSEVGILSEARGAGGAILGLGILILLGAFFPTLTFTSIIVLIVVFLSYGLARLLGIATDGVPGPDIIKGIISEFIAGLIGIFAFLKYRKKEPANESTNYGG